MSYRFSKDSKRMEERHLKENNGFRRRSGLRSNKNSFWNIKWDESDDEGLKSPKKSWADRCDDNGKSPKKSWADRCDENVKSPKKSYADRCDEKGKSKKSWANRCDENGKSPKKSWADRFDENVKSPKKSWADQCEEYFQEQEIAMESPDKRDRNAERRHTKPSKARKSLENCYDFAEGHEACDEEYLPDRSHLKRERNIDDSPSQKSSIGNHPEFVKRRQRAGSDGISNTSSSMNSSDTEEGPKLGKQYETDPAVLSRRQKQIDYGKNTKAYKMYLQAVPKHERELHHVVTPKKLIVYSRRSWDNQIRIWRKKLHLYDPESDEEEDNADLSDMIAMMSPK